MQKEKRKKNFIQYLYKIITYSQNLTQRFIPKQIFTFPLTIQNLILLNINLQVEKTSAWRSKGAEVERGDQSEIAESWCFFVVVLVVGWEFVTCV